ncbi:SIP domain-containing protein [Nocardioides sp.]|uniref:SIP domain-containing protein n=1 Tax=Nocardioides sp. TaxID=35761 RepID=UPI00262996B2|nr:SIP domain-containing protein [Nocardioides sp.]
MRSHRRRRPVDHVLIAGDLGDLAAIRAVLADLDPSSYGQVLLETGGVSDVPLLATPARVTVHLLGSTHVADALETWVEEWLPLGVETAPDVKVWIGGRSHEAMTTLYRSLPVLAQRL